MEVTLNGECITLASQTLSTALTHWGYTIGTCAVALNGDFISHTQYANVQLTDGDSLQIVIPMQGG
ncbi:MAG: sulfur carrier protein ThiS [Legionellales bacterium]|nr:sulfur carrier protein ThiS [Legionellales bacterium]